MSEMFNREYGDIPVPNVTRIMRNRAKFMVEALKNAKRLPNASKRKMSSISNG